MVYSSIESVFFLIDNSNFMMAFSRIHKMKMLGNQSFLKFYSESDKFQQINFTNLTILNVSQLCEEVFCLKTYTKPFFSLKNVKNIILNNLQISESKISNLFLIYITH